jgi:hypothetical protein
MEAITGSPKFGFQTEWKRSFIEDRVLNKPVLLSYPDFWSAAEASGISRLYAGVHWAAGNHEGLKLGRRVGEAVWTKAQSYLSGTASSVLAASTFLAPPHWYHRSANAGESVEFELDNGLAVKLDGAGKALEGHWVSRILDPLPAGQYRLSAKFKISVKRGTKLTAGLSVNCPFRADTKLAGATHEFGGGSGEAMMPMEIDFVSDGRSPLEFEFNAAVRDGAAIATLSNLYLSRVG